MPVTTTVHNATTHQGSGWDSGVLSLKVFRDRSFCKFNPSKCTARKHCIAVEHSESRHSRAHKKLTWLSKRPQYYKFLQLPINFTSACTFLHIIAKCDSYQGVWKLKTVKAACTTFVSHPSSVLLSHSTLWTKLQTFVNKSFALFLFLWKHDLIHKMAKYIYKMLNNLIQLN